jgi:hypothetical protein
VAAVSAIVTSLLYITIGLALAGVVGRALTRSGRAFLRTKFDGQDGVADAVDRLLVVAFYLLAAGFIALTVPTGAHIADGGQALRLLSVKLGELLLVLGALHLASTITFARLRGSRTSAMLAADEDAEFPGGPGAAAHDRGISESSTSGYSTGDYSTGDSGTSDSGIGRSAADRFGPAGRRAPRPLAAANTAARTATATTATAHMQPARTQPAHMRPTRAQTGRPATTNTPSARAAAARAAASGLRVTPPPPGLWRPRRAAH